MPARYRLIAMLALMALSLAPTLRAQPAPTSSQELVEGINAVLDSAAFENAFWAVKIVNLPSGETVYERNAEKSFIPASNTKLYTTAAALDLLGPDYRYRTGLYTDGEIDRDGVLQGNVIVRGSGDPVIGGRFNGGDLTQVFRAWADSLRAAGITRIEGDIIGDDDVFDDLPLGYGWSWDDEPYWYSAEISGLSFNDNNVDFAIEGRDVRAPAQVQWEPFGTDYIQVVNVTQTIHPDSSIDEGYARARGTNTIRLSSLVPAGRTDTESLTIANPTLFFTHVLREALLRGGLSVAGRPVDVDEMPIKPDYDGGSLRRIAVHASPPLAEIAKVVNQRSQNFYAEALIKTLGAERPLSPKALGTRDYEPGSAEMGIAAAMETFLEAGIDTSRIQLVDGSGLSRMNLVTAEMTSALLRYFWDHPEPDVRQAFYASLPRGGYDGTLRYRYRSGAARGNVRAKTGTVTSASALSGYVTSAAGTPFAFVLMCNHYTIDTNRIRAVQDAIVEQLARYRPQ